MKLLILCCQNNKDSGCIYLCGQVLHHFTDIHLCYLLVLYRGCTAIYVFLCTVTWLGFSLALIRFESPTRPTDLLICHGQCTRGVQRHLAGVGGGEGRGGAVRCEGLDLGSLMCMSKTIPDLGLAVWAAWQEMCSTVNANEQDKRSGRINAENKIPGTHWVTALCSLLFSMQLTLELHYNIALVFR